MGATQKKRKQTFFKGDRPLWLIIAILCFTSIIVVYSSTASMAYKEAGGNTSHFVLKQLGFIIAGFVITFIVHYMNPRAYQRWSKYLFYITLAMAILAYTPWFSDPRNGAYRWFRIPGTSLSLLASEPLKLALVLYLALKLGRRQLSITRMKILPSFSPKNWRGNSRANLDILFYNTQPLVLPIVLATGAVIFSNLSTAMIILLVGLIMLMAGRVKKREMRRLITMLVVSMIVLILVMKLLGIGRADTWVNRFESFVSPITSIVVSENEDTHRDEFQKTQAKIAIASGGLTGKGPGKSTQRSQLPHPYSDFLYAFIIEEYGVAGALFILTLYLWICYRLVVIVKKSRGWTDSLTVVGLGLMILFPAFVNMMVSTGLSFVTGQSLPLVSLGGTSTIFTSISFGIILGISRKADDRLLRQKRLEEIEAQRLEGEFVGDGSEAEDIKTQNILEESYENVEEAVYIAQEDIVEAGSSYVRGEEFDDRSDYGSDYGREEEGSYSESEGDFDGGYKDRDSGRGYAGSYAGKYDDSEQDDDAESDFEVIDQRDIDEETEKGNSQRIYYDLED